MTSLKLTEAIATAMIAKLREGMPARIAQINDQFGDEVVMRPPDDDHYFDGRMKNLAKTPAIFVMEGPTIFNQEGSHSFLTSTEMRVYVFESDQNGILLARRLRRQTRAMIETLWDDPPLARLEGSAYSLVPRRTSPGVALTNPESPDAWQSFNVTVFRAEQEET